MNTKPVYLPVLEILLWLPFAFFAWYQLAPLLHQPPAWLAGLALTKLWPGPEWMEGLAVRGRMLEAITAIRLPVAAASAGSHAFFSFDVNPLRYSYGLPFLAALIFAVTDSFGGKIRKLFLAWLSVLVPVQAFCFGFAVLKVLAFNLDPVLSQQLISTVWQREGIGLAYQFSTLILPTVTPVLLWFFFYHEQIINRRNPL